MSFPNPEFKFSNIKGDYTSHVSKILGSLAPVTLSFHQHIHSGSTYEILLSSLQSFTTFSSKRNHHCFIIAITVLNVISSSQNSRKLAFI